MFLTKQYFTVQLQKRSLLKRALIFLKVQYTFWVTDFISGRMETESTGFLVFSSLAVYSSRVFSWLGLGLEPSCLGI